MRNKFSIFLFASTFVLSGCYSSKYYQVNSQKLLGIEWKLMYVKSAQSSSLLIPTGDKIPTLTFAPDGKTAFGNSGCNRFTGDVKWNGGKLAFGPIAGAKMFCMDGMEIENAVLKAFQETTGYEIDKGCLLLKKGREVLASFTTAK